MSHLAFWTGKDMTRMDRLFRRSGLMRDKYRDRDDYRRDTIRGADSVGVIRFANALTFAKAGKTDLFIDTVNSWGLL